MLEFVRHHSREALGRVSHRLQHLHTSITSRTVSTPATSTAWLHVRDWGGMNIVLLPWTHTECYLHLRRDQSLSCCLPDVFLLHEASCTPPGNMVCRSAPLLQVVLVHAQTNAAVLDCQCCVHVCSVHALSAPHPCTPCWCKSASLSALAREHCLQY